MFDRILFSRHVQEDEQVARIVHAHWIPGLKELLLPTVSVSLTIFLLSAHPTRFFVYGISLWAIISLVWWARNFCDWYLDVWIITDKGVTSVEWKGWFHRATSRILYSDVEGVGEEIHGVLGTVFRYGTVSIEKISTGGAVSFPDVPRPKSVATLILKNAENYVHTKNLKNAKHVHDILAEYVSREIHDRSIGGGKSSESEEA